jgi:hypothetical protein
MKGHRIKAILIIFSVSFFSLLSTQELRAEDTGLIFADFQWGGSIELGYRFTDIDGSKDRYKETVYLMEGLRLFDISLFGKNLNPGTGIVDSVSLTGRSIGDPFPSGRIEIKKNKTYDFTASYHQYKYHFNREDNIWLTDNHDFSTKFSLGTVNLSIFPKDDIRLNFGYRHWERDGETGVPRLMFPFPLPQDLREGLNEYYASADFSLGGWDFHLKESFWNFRNKDKIVAQGFFEKREENMNTVVSTLKAHTQFGERLDFDGAVIYAHSNGWSNISTLPEIGIRSGKGEVQHDTLIGELGLSYQILKNLIVHADYRFHTYDQDGSMNTDPFTLDPFLSNNGRVNPNTEYQLKAHTGTLQLEYIPRDNLLLRGGYQFQYQDMEGEFFGNERVWAGAKNPENTTQWVHGWVASVDWKPFKCLNVFGEYKGSNTNDPYTWISPESTHIAKIKVKYDTPIKNLNLKGTFSWRRRTNPDQNNRVDAQDYTLTTSYQPIFLPKLSLDASVTYEKILDKKDIYNTIPNSFEKFTFNSDALIYSGGISYEGIFKGLGARIYGSYAKTMKENPQRYADAVISLWYKNKWVTPIVTYEKTYLNDHVKRHESFNANLVTFSLRKEF